MNIDYEHEYQKDMVYAIERQKDIEAAWQKAEEENNFKIRVKYETKHKSPSFRRTYKKILFLRSHLPVKTY